MANAIKEFFKKKKTEAKFKLAGPGHKLTDEQRPATASGVSRATPSCPAPVSAAGQRAGQAALMRIQQQQQQTQRKPGSTLENILQDERKRITEEYKMKEQLEALEKKQNFQRKQQDDCYKEFEENQLFYCPEFEIQESCTKDKLMELIRKKIELEFAEDLTLQSALIVKNSTHPQVEQCLAILDKILSNLSTKNPDEFEKFRRIRKSKIEQKVLSVDGAEQFLTSIGFNIDEEGEWFVYQPKEEQEDMIDYYRDVLKDAQQFPIVLDRQVAFPTFNQGEDDISDDFFNLSLGEVQKEQQNLTAKKELEETLRTRAMREQHSSKRQCKFTRLRIKKPDGSLMEATFYSTETLADVKTWIMQVEELENVQLFCGRNHFLPDDYFKTLNDLGLVPTASLFISW